MPNISIVRLRELERAEQEVKEQRYRNAAKEAGDLIMQLSGLLIAERAVTERLSDHDKIVLKEVRRRVPTAFHAWAELTQPKLNEIGW